FKPRNCSFDSFGKWYRRLETGYQPFDFTVVEDHAGALVSQKRPYVFRVEPADFVGSHVDDTGFRTHRRSQLLVNLVPGQHFIGSDMDGFADCLLVAQKPVKSPGEILGVGEYPERGAVTMNH